MMLAPENNPRPWRLRLLPLLLTAGLLLTAAAQPGPAATGTELLDAGRADDAIKLLTPLAAGNNALAFNQLCRVYYALGEWDAAVRNCEQAAQLQPNNAEFQLWLGRSYGEKANVASALSAYSLARKAVAAFTTAHSLNPQSIPIARSLAEFYANAPSVVGGGSSKAMRLAAELEHQHPADAAWVRGMVATNSGEFDTAAQEYQTSIHFAHESAETVLEFARFLKGRKRWEEFQHAVERALLAQEIHPLDRYDAAEMLLKTNRNLQVAEEQMRIYIQSGHTVEDAPLFCAHYLLGEILLKRGRKAEAAGEYRAALALASSYRPAINALSRLGVH